MGKNAGKILPDHLLFGHQQTFLDGFQLAAHGVERALEQLDLVDARLGKMHTEIAPPHLIGGFLKLPQRIDDTGQQDHEDHDRGHDDQQQKEGRIHPGAAESEAHHTFGLAEGIHDLSGPQRIFRLRKVKLPKLFSEVQLGQVFLDLALLILQKTIQ